MLGVPLRRIHREAAFTDIEPEDVARLGARNSRLGADTIVGEYTEDLEALILQVGPVPLAVYYQFQEGEAARRLASVSRLCTPWHQRCYVDWLVEDPGRAPRLGIDEENSRLGINTHLGVA
jgi:predicted component of type VI protein secretion system